MNGILPHSAVFIRVKEEEEEEEEDESQKEWSHKCAMPVAKSSTRGKIC